MNEARFTNREITQMINNIDEKLDAHAETHQKILEQVMFTNGKVKKLTLQLSIVGTAAGTAILMGGGGEFIKFIFAIL